MTITFRNPLDQQHCAWPALDKPDASLARTRSTYSPGALNVAAEDARRLTVQPEGIAAAPRTLTVQPQPLHELIARQLSDREHDQVFHESMAVAGTLARSVLG